MIQSVRDFTVVLNSRLSLPEHEAAEAATVSMQGQKQ